MRRWIYIFFSFLASWNDERNIPKHRHPPLPTCPATASPPEDLHPNILPCRGHDGSVHDTSILTGTIPPSQLHPQRLRQHTSKSVPVPIPVPVPVPVPIPNSQSQRSDSVLLSSVRFAGIHLTLPTVNPQLTIPTTIPACRRPPQRIGDFTYLTWRWGTYPPPSCSLSSGSSGHRRRVPCTLY